MATAITTVVRDVVIAEDEGSFMVDENVIAALPPGTLLLSATYTGASAWTQTARLCTQAPDGMKKSYFLKYATETIGKTMVEGEYHSLTAIHELIPTFAPKPYAWGKLKKNDNHFLLMDFIHLNTASIDTGKFCSRIAEMHKISVSPTGKFGFHITTCHGPNWQNTEWESSWCVYFTRLLKQFFYREIERNGPYPEYEAAFEALVEDSIPQLLEPLQTEGRDIKPSLVHGDLWEGNLGTDARTSNPVVFDCSVMYAHNEYELGMWTRDVVRLSDVHIQEYWKTIPPSEPTDQWGDRNRLYSIKFNLAHSIALPGTKDGQRELIFKDMRYLLENYPKKINSKMGEEEGRAENVQYWSTVDATFEIPSWLFPSSFVFMG